MNKTLKALLKGYVKFRVRADDTETFFWTYNAAHALAHKSRWATASFDGWLLWKLGWRGFYVRVKVGRNPNIVINPSLNIGGGMNADRWSGDMDAEL